MMSEQWNTLPMATVHLVEERRCEALAAQYRVQQQALQRLMSKAMEGEET